jgi:selenocysteine lyase/cysteine desulfurase
MGVPATVRASIGLYNNEEDLFALVEGVKKVKEMFG